MRYRYFRLIGLVCLLGLGAISSAMAANDQVIRVTDLEALAAQAREQKLPILLMFSQQQCPYCSIMEENYLRPMLRSGKYTDKVIIRKLRIDDFGSLTDFNGNRIEPGQLSSRYGASVTPTLVFLNAEGKEIAPKLVGLGTEGFFAGDIDNAIDTALLHLRSVAINP